MPQLLIFRILLKLLLLRNHDSLLRIILFAKIELQMWFDNPLKTRDQTPISDQLRFQRQLLWERFLKSRNNLS